MKWIMVCIVFLLLQYHVGAFILLPVTQQDMIQQVADQGLDILHALQSKQKDCFRKSTLALEADCQVLASDETSHMKYALMLTKCELATADIQIPKACQLDDSTCVKKLAINPQTWTTYSGYYRDVVTICFSVRYPMEKELLLQAQDAMATFQTKIYQKMQQQQQDFYQWRQQEMELLQKMQSDQSDLWNDMSQQQGRAASTLLDLISLIQDAKDKAGDMNTIQQTTMTSHLDQLDQLTRTWNQVFYSMDHQVGSMFSKMDAFSLLQNQSLSRWQASQDQAIEQWQHSIHRANQSITSLLNSTEYHLYDLKHDILELHTGLSFLFTFARHLMDHGIHPIIVSGLMFLCWILPTSPAFTLIKTLALGYQMKSTCHWLSLLICFGTMMKLWIDCQQQHYPDLLLSNSERAAQNERRRMELYYKYIMDEE